MGNPNDPLDDDYEDMSDEQLLGKLNKAVKDAEDWDAENPDPKR